MTKRLNNLINFLWIKVEEKFSKPSHAFRYFDEQCRSKVSYKEFESGIEKLKIKFHRDEMKRIFEYLDSDKDKYLNYIEFSKLNKSSNITSRLPGYSFVINNSNPSNSRLKSRVKSNDVRADQNYAGKNFKLLFQMKLTSFRSQVFITEGTSMEEVDLAARNRDYQTIHGLVVINMAFHHLLMTILAR